MREVGLQCILLVLSRFPGVGAMPPGSSAQGTPKENAVPQHLLVLHTLGEGAHAHGDILTSLPCTVYLRAEYLVGDTTSFAWLKTFFQGSLQSLGSRMASLLHKSREDWLASGHTAAISHKSPLNNHLVKLHAEINGSKRRNINASCGSCVSRGMIFRAEPETVQDWCAKGLFDSAERKIQPVVLVRTDLLRWSLSAYNRRDAVYGEDNPQFCGVSSLKNGVVKPCATERKMVTINLTILAKVASHNVNRWRNVAQTLSILQQCGVQPMVSIYESFQDAGLAQDQLSDYLVPCAPRRHQMKNIPGFETGVTVHKAHSNQISDFVSNAREVYDFFHLHRVFPTFTEVLRAAHVTVSSVATLQQLSGGFTTRVVQDSSSKRSKSRRTPTSP